MRLAIFSDTHFEFHKDQGKSFINSLDPSGIDVLILAGDICNLQLLKQTLTAFCKKYSSAQILYVKGNHEHYKSSFQEIDSILKSIKVKNLHVLENDIVTIDNQRFLGCTLWFREFADNVLFYDFSDFRLIKNPKEIYQKNEQSIKFLEREMQEGDVIITHHLPTRDVVHPKFIGNQLNRFFVCELGYLIEEKKPKLWCFGHGHNATDMIIKNTRFVSNPLAYPHEKSECDINLVIEI